MLQKLPKFLKVALKTASCLKVAEQLVDMAKFRQIIGGAEAPSPLPPSDGPVKYIAQRFEKNPQMCKIVLSDFKIR